MSIVFGAVTIFLPSPGLRGVGPAEELSIGLKAPQLRLLALTVATEETDGYKRFMKSSKTNNIDVKVKNYSWSFCHPYQTFHTSLGGDYTTLSLDSEKAEMLSIKRKNLSMQQNVTDFLHVLRSQETTLPTPVRCQLGWIERELPTRGSVLRNSLFLTLNNLYSIYKIYTIWNEQPFLILLLSSCIHSPFVLSQVSFWYCQILERLFLACWYEYALMCGLTNYVNIPYITLIIIFFLVS